MPGIYVHFPFCSSKCIYCDFYSKVRKDWTPYVNALVREIDERKDYLKGVPPTTLYFGGGTPSVLPVDELSHVCDALRSVIDTSKVEEFTVEVNPDDVTYEKALKWKDLGVSRISMGVQSFCDSHLSMMRRRHSAADAMKAFADIRRAGFRNISIDLIFGFEGLSEKEWTFNVGQASSLSPEHLSCYQMMGKCASADDSACERQYLALQQSMEDAGYLQYEISNYCRPGFESKHNSSYWTRQAYLGLGAGAHSFDGENHRSWNISDIDAYIRERPYGGETLSDRDIFNEKVMLGLRTSAGVPVDLIEKNPAFNTMVEAGNLVVDDSSVRIPKEKFLVADWIINRLFA